MLRRHCDVGLALALGALVPASYLLAAQAPAPLPRLTFTKTLKGSTPEYFALSLDTSGRGAYDSHPLQDPANPRPVQISAATTARIFALVHALGDLRARDLNSRHKVANMGLKMLAYENGEETNRVQFNYTEDRNAQQLAETLEKIANVEERITGLEYAMKYDRLSLPEDLREIQDGMADNNFVEAELMLPTLEKIANDSHFMHLAQSRAQQIIERIQEKK
jgi:hypothetical protein